MKGTTNRTTPAHAEEAAATPSSPRLTIRFESSMTRFAEEAAASDRAYLSVLESLSAVVLEQVFLNNEFDVPDGSEPFRCETIAGTFERRSEEAEQAAEGAGEDTAQTSDDSTLPIDAPTNGAVFYDEEFARAQKEQAAEAARRLLPEFPDLDSGICFSKWVYDNVDSDDLVEISTVLGTNSGRTYRQLSTAMTVFYGLPRFADRVRAGEFTRAHVDAAAQQCQNVPFEHLPKLDEFLAAKKADITCDSLRRSLTKLISLLVPPVDAAETAKKRRRVDVEGFKDGSACLTVSGPSAEIFSCYHRIEAMARAIHGKNNSTFNLPAGVELDDDRSISQLEYDLFIRPVPELSVKVVSLDPITGIQTAKEAPALGADGELLPGLDTEDGLADYARQVAAQPPAADVAGSGAMPVGSAFTLDSEDEADQGPFEYSIKLRMPTNQSWLANQAATVVTVPFLTLTGDSDLPGTFANGSPIPAEVARTIAGRSKTVQRILTDPATGTPIDAKATSYPVPKDLRKTLVEQWTVCTAPGCSRRAEKSEMDHVNPFFHLDPLKGGLTRFGNIQPICKLHHALKTAGRYRVTMPKSGVVDYEFRHGISTTVSAPEQPINVAQVLDFAALAHVGLERWTLPTAMIPAAPRVLELMPGESTIRERDEKKRLAAEEKRLREEREAKQRQLSEAFRAQRVARQRLWLERCLDWENSVFQPCLPAGTNPAATKQLTGNRRYAQAVKWARLSGIDINTISYDPNAPANAQVKIDTHAPAKADESAAAAQPKTTPDPDAAARPKKAPEPEGTGADDPWDSRFVPRVNWDHDPETDPPPF